MAGARSENTLNSKGAGDVKEIKHGGAERDLRNKIAEVWNENAPVSHQAKLRINKLKWRGRKAKTRLLSRALISVFSLHAPAVL
jgi:hypothetical protein